MNATSATLPTASSRSFGWTVNIYAKEAKYEFLKMLRLPVYAVSTLAFPLMFYVLFGLLLNGHQATFGGTKVAAYLIASYGSFGVMGAALFGFGVGVAVERGQGWLEVKRASPMPPYAYFAAKIVMCLLFSGLIAGSLLVLGFAFGGVRLSTVQTLELLGTLVAGSVPFCAMGLALSYFIGPNSAPAAVNCFYLPLSFASGLWIPIDMLPNLMQKIAPALPPFHLAQIALGVIGPNHHGSAIGHWESLLGFTLICLGVARLGYHRDEGKLYG